MKSRIVPVLAAVLASAAISASALHAQNDVSAALPLPELMGHVFQRNAQQLWAWTAEETDANGSRSGAPVSEEDWENAESDALTLRQLAILLQGPDYRQDDPRWARLAGDLEAAATASAGSAERKDLPALIRAGDAINAACVACHWAFAPQLEETPPPVPLS